MLLLLLLLIGNLFGQKPADVRALVMKSCIEELKM